MANLNVNNYHNLKLRINKDEYWDFFVNKDSYGCYGARSDGFYDKCLITYIDLCDNECYDGDKWIYSKSGYTWDGSTALYHTMHNISFCGVDNGLFNYRRDRITNREFVDIFTKSVYDIDDNDYRLKLHAVSGSTVLYDYPLHKEKCRSKLNGGFYQGFFKTECGKYQVLPSKFEDGDVFVFEFTMKKCALEKESDKTLNDKYPNNKGIFFFLGTRAENKWVYQYIDDDGCEQLDMSEFVEDGEIDKKSFIIKDLSDVRLEEETLDIDGYVNFNYYDEELYNGGKCDWNDMSDYLVISTKPRVIDESAPHITLDTWCCSNDGLKTDSVLKPFFKGCGCPISYRNVNHYRSDKNKEISNFDAFGDEYIISFEDVCDDLDSLEYVERDLDISDFEYESDNGIPFSQANQYYFYTDNKFLFFNRTKTGETVSSFDEGVKYMYYGRKNTFKGNLFILMNRTKSGYTVSNIDELREKDANHYNPYLDIYDNAMAFRITDDGEIGYRLITIDCEKDGENKVKVLEGYSNKGVIPNCEWFTVDVKVIFLGGNKMKFKFYVNGKLVYITSELPRIRLRHLNDLKEKQEGVPYNISIGGGSQGLAETVQFNYMLNPSRVYPIEENFGGSFIGYIKTFRIYDCMIGKDTIEDNYKYEMKKIKEQTN